MAASISQFAVGKTEGGTTVDTSATPLTTAASGSTFLIISSDCNDLDTPQDNKGNTYVACGLGNQNAGNMIRGWLCTDGVGGAGHYAFATKNNPGYPVFAFIEIAGSLLAGAQDTGAYNQTGDDFSPFEITTTGASLAQADNLVFAVFTHGASGDDLATAGAPFTMLYQEMDTGHWWPLAIATYNTTTNAPVTATITHPAAVQTSLLIITIRSAAAASGITGAGNIASAQAVGAPSIRAAVTPAGIATAQAFGAPTIGASIGSAGGIASAQAVGAPTTGGGIAAAGIASTQTVGAPLLAAGISSAGAIASGGSVGAPAVGGSGILVSGIASAEALGQPAIAAGLQAAGVGSSEVLPAPIVGARVAAQGIPSGMAFGLPLVGGPVAIVCLGIASGEAFGLPRVGALSWSREIHLVPPEDRIFRVRAEDRTHRAPPENRIHKVTT